MSTHPAPTAKATDRSEEARSLGVSSREKERGGGNYGGALGGLGGPKLDATTLKPAPEAAAASFTPSLPRSGLGSSLCCSLHNSIFNFFYPLS